LEDTRCLAALRDQIDLLEGETVFEGWAACRVGRSNRQPGLALLTNWRLIVADINGGFSAVPIAKVDRIDLPSPTVVRLTAWYETVSLSFESAAAAATLVNCLRQDAECQAVIWLGMELMARPLREITAATMDPTPCGPTMESTDQRLLMAEPSL
jgi:hypothetical protein